MRHALAAKNEQSDTAWVVETICKKGCKRVWHDITALEQGEPLPETDGLNQHQLQDVLQQLKEVMSTYSYRCGAE